MYVFVDVLYIMCVFVCLLAGVQCVCVCVWWLGSASIIVFL